MASLRLRGKRWWGKVRIPQHLVSEYGGKRHMEKNLQTSDRKAAEAEAAIWEGMLRIEWAEKLGTSEPETSSLRGVYRKTKEQADAGKWTADGLGGDPVSDGIELAIDDIAEEVGQRELTDLQQATLTALKDARNEREGKPAPTRVEYDPSWTELTDDYMRLWATKGNLKASNTASQKRATFTLFGKFWKGKPIRDVRKKDAAAFHDALRQMDPHWSRSPTLRSLTWDALQTACGGLSKGMADGTINRHMAVLQSLWHWSMEREFCNGNNPFSGFTLKIVEGRNRSGYRPWTTEELQTLWDNPPKREDLREVMLVAMFSGMRLNEIASLTWEQIKEEDGVSYFDVLDAKTPAGNRQVPIHPALSWLVDRKPSTGISRVWPKFNPEGPGKKPGADAGNDFSRYKIGLGFQDRQKTFHSFRKNVTGQMERASVPENAWAQILGHEKGFTYGTYSPDGLTLGQKAKIISKIDYPHIRLGLPST